MTKQLNNSLSIYQRKFNLKKRLSKKTNTMMKRIVVMKILKINATTEIKRKKERTKMMIVAMIKKVRKKLKAKLKFKIKNNPKTGMKRRMKVMEKKTMMKKGNTYGAKRVKIGISTTKKIRKRVNELVNRFIHNCLILYNKFYKTIKKRQ